MAQTDLKRTIRIVDDAPHLENPNDVHDIRRTHSYFCSLMDCGIKYVELRVVGIFMFGSTPVQYTLRDNAHIVSYDLARNAINVVIGDASMRVRLTIDGALPCTIVYIYDPYGNVQWREF